jgi:hypothetical protein
MKLFLIVAGLAAVLTLSACGKGGLFGEQYYEIDRQRGGDVGEAGQGEGDE